MDFFWFIAAALYFIFAHLIAKYIGAHRQIGYNKSKFWSIVLSPIIGLIIIYSSPKIKHKTTN